MTYRTMQSMQMSSHASAASADASFSCPAHTAVTARLDAIFVASIIIIRRVNLAILGFFKYYGFLLNNIKERSGLSTTSRQSVSPEFS